MMKTAIAAMCLVSATATSAAPASAAPDKLTAMFQWWNGAYSKPGAYTADAFREFFTEDATLVVNGKLVVEGVDQWSQYFNKIQSAGGVVEAVLPFRRVAQVGDTIYTYNIMRIRSASAPVCMINAGYATLKAGKISSLVVVRSPVDPSTDPDC
jgi:ketosteroid isomerase-like protein